MLFSVVGVPPRVMGIGPAFAIPAILKHVGIQKEDVDLFEVRVIFHPQRILSSFHRYWAWLAGQ